MWTDRDPPTVTRGFRQLWLCAPPSCESAFGTPNSRCRFLRTSPAETFFLVPEKVLERLRDDINTHDLKNPAASSRFNKEGGGRREGRLAGSRIQVGPDDVICLAQDILINVPIT
jgi:hypothetical protein